MLNATHRSVLRALYELADDDVPADLDAIAARLDLPTAHLVPVLLVLDRAGLVDASRRRLTLAGLAHAVVAPVLARVRAFAA
jgi:DNA-binding IscR family transcriptional regulator